MSKTIVYLHQHYSSPSGWSAQRCHRQATILARHGYDVTVVCGEYDRDQSSCESLNYAVRRIPVPYRSNSGTARRLLSFMRFTFRSLFLIRSLKPDLIISSSTPLSTWISAFFARKPSKSLWITEERDAWPEIPFSLGLIGSISRRVVLAVKKFMLLRADGHIVVTPLLQRYYSTAYGTAAPSVCIPNQNSTNVPKVCSFENKVLKLVYTGSLGWISKTSDFEDLAELIYERNIPVELHIFGGGFYESTLKLASERYPKILYLHHPLSHSRLGEILHNFDAGLLWFRRNRWLEATGSPNKLADYVSANLHVISNIPGYWFRQALENKSGTLVDNVFDLAEKLGHGKIRQTMQNLPTKINFESKTEVLPGFVDSVFMKRIL